MGILAWVVLGLLAGAIAKALHPGPDPGGLIVTLLIGVAGAFLGGYLGSVVLHHGVTGFNLWSLLLSVAGAFVLLMIYHWAMVGRGGRRTMV